MQQRLLLSHTHVPQHPLQRAQQRRRKKRKNSGGGNAGHVTGAHGAKNIGVGIVAVDDAVEIDAGDTYAYDTEGNATKREREVKAADRIFHILPPDQEEYFRSLWEEFEANETPEARFAKALDNVQPTMLNHASGGRAWKEHEVAISQIYKRNEKTAEGSKALWEHAKEHFIEPHVKKEIKED